MSAPFGRLFVVMVSAVAETGASVLKVRSALIERVLAPRPGDAENRVRAHPTTVKLMLFYGFSTAIREPCRSLRKRL